MTEEEDFKRVAREVFDKVKVVDVQDEKSEIRKVEETERWLKDLDKKHEQVIEMLNTRIMFGKIPQYDKARMLNAIIEIKNECLNK